MNCDLNSARLILRELHGYSFYYMHTLKLYNHLSKMLGTKTLSYNEKVRDNHLFERCSFAREHRTMLNKLIRNIFNA